MNQQEKEQLISFVEKEKQDLTFEYGKYSQTHVGFIWGTRLIEFIERMDEPQRVKVPAEFDEWYRGIERIWDETANKFALWKICQFGFGKGFEDVYDNKTSKTLSNWVDKNKDDAIDAVMHGYDIKVEEYPKYRVELPFEYWHVGAAEVKTESFYLGFNINCNETRIMTTKNGWKGFETKLDEETIKAIDERYWPFAVLVDKEVDDNGTEV